jgi:hypothetical protein
MPYKVPLSLVSHFADSIEFSKLLAALRRFHIHTTGMVFLAVQGLDGGARLGAADASGVLHHFAPICRRARSSSTCSQISEILP